MSDQTDDAAEAQNPNAAIVAQLARSAEKNARLTRWVFFGDPGPQPRPEGERVFADTTTDERGSDADRDRD
jgi:hypothetical protein